jgi:hypothetical protein
MQVPRRTSHRNPAGLAPAADNGRGAPPLGCVVRIDAARSARQQPAEIARHARAPACIEDVAEANFLIQL